MYSCFNVFDCFLPERMKLDIPVDTNGCIFVSSNHLQIIDNLLVSLGCIHQFVLLVAVLDFAESYMFAT